MKKIFLIDDNYDNQREIYEASFVDENLYEDCLTHIEKLHSKSDFSFIQEAACIMVHDTLADYIDGHFCPSSHKARERIDDILENIDIPKVMFSDGHNQEADWKETSPNVVYSIKKSEFYLHLKPFLDEYRLSGQIDLRIIAYGKDYMKYLMRLWYKNIIEKLSNVSENGFIDEEMIDKRSLKLFIENANLGNVTFDYIMHKIEDNAYTTKDFIERINNIISNVINYGKNISAWE